jgi:hypothetical protein
MFGEPIRDPDAIELWMPVAVVVGGNVLAYLAC